jgi:hypothetical protein
MEKVVTPPLDSHPLADIFPLLDEKGPAFLTLAEDIKANGLQEPIVLYGGKILEAESISPNR